MNKIIIYPQSREVIVRLDFRADYIDYDETGEDIMPFSNVSYYKTGQKLNAIGKVKSTKFSSGYGYIIFDEDLEKTLTIDVTLFEN